MRQQQAIEICQNDELLFLRSLHNEHDVLLFLRSVGLDARPNAVPWPAWSARFRPHSRWPRQPSPESRPTWDFRRPKSRASPTTLISAAPVRPCAPLSRLMLSCSSVWHRSRLEAPGEQCERGSDRGDGGGNAGRERLLRRLPLPAALRQLVGHEPAAATAARSGGRGTGTARTALRQVSPVRSFRCSILLSCVRVEGEGSGSEAGRSLVGVVWREKTVAEEGEMLSVMERRE